MTFLVVGFFVSTTRVFSAPYYEGRIRVTVRDTARNKDIAVTIVYPADSLSGDNRPIVGTGTNTIPSFGVVVMGHGFQMPVTAYKSFATNICQNVGNYVVILPETGSGLFPNHNDFALDMIAVAQYMQYEGARTGSVWYGHVVNDVVFAGHSMGGGAAVLAAKQAIQSGKLNVTSLIGLAPAETNPSSSAAATFVTCPTLILAGGVDCVTPLAGTVKPIYNNVASKCKVLAVIPGASHCQFADANTTCNLGELNCQATISRTIQLSRSWQYVNAILRRSDDVAKVVNDTQIESTFTKLDRSKLQVSKSEACVGETVSLSYNGASSELLWLPDSARGNTHSIKVAEGKNRVTLVNTACFSSSAIDTTIIGLATPTIGIQGSKVICPGDSALLSVSTNGTAENPVSIRWSNGNTSSAIVVKDAGVYTATASSLRGCGSVTASHDLRVEAIPSISIQLVGDTVFCGGIGSLEARLAGGVDLVQNISWSNGDTSRVVPINELGTQTLSARMRARDGLQCTITSDTVVFTTRRIDATVPSVSFVSDTLWSTIADYYQWKFNGMPIQGATKQFIVPVKSGAYSVTTRHNDEYGCRATSKATEVTLTTVNADPYSSTTTIVQLGSSLRVQSVGGPTSIRIMHFSGRTVFESTYDGAADTYEVDLSTLPPSVYAVQLRCEASAITRTVLIWP